MNHIPECIAHHSACVAPVKATLMSAGFDLASVEAVTIAPGERAVVSTGLSITCPPGTYGRLAPRSGLAAKHGIDILAGVIDSDYTGIVKAVVLNTGTDPFEVTPGMRICQLIFERYEAFPVTKYMNMKLDGTLDPTERGSRGFGSSGHI
jgi:dUTP pyrophosphatase